MNNLEPHVEERIQKAKERAQKIVNGLVETEEDIIFCMRFFLSKIYQIPIFHKYFEELTFDQLIFECELHRTSRQTTPEKTTELINDNKEELSGMFDDWVDQDLGDFTEDAKNFMETGEFKD